MPASASSLATKLRSVVQGGMWHGPSMQEALEGVSASVAAAYPIDEAHSIWELVLHVGQWAEIVTERLAGSKPPISPDRNFPPVGDPTEANWIAAIDRTRQLYLALAAQVEASDYETLWADPEDGSTPLGAQLLGVIEHGVYHAGQIVLLRRAAGA